MQERIRSLFTLLERDADNEEAFQGLEDIVTGEDSEQRPDELRDELKKGRLRLVHAGVFEAACKVIDFELALADDARREAELLEEQARIYDQELFDQKKAVSLLQRIVALLPDDEDWAQKVASIDEERSNWEQIATRFAEQAEEADEPSLKAHMLFSAAERTYKNHKRGKEIPVLLFRALDADSGHLRAARLLEKVLKERKRWDDLANLYTTLAEHRTAKEERAQMLLAAAHTCQYRLQDEDAAAGHYAEVFDLIPGQETATRFLVKYYEDKEDWDHLVTIYEDALRGNLGPEEEAAYLTQAGMVHWKMRGDLASAEKLFKRLRKLDPSHEGMLNFYRSFCEETDEKTKLVQILSEAQRNTDVKELADRLTKEVAQVAGAGGGNVERAIDAWKAVLREEPDNADAREELKRLYWATEKWNALLDLLRHEAEAIPDENRREKVAVLEEMVAIYRDRLNLGTMVINTYKSILVADPDNDSAMRALSETYEKEGRWNDLIGLLSDRAEKTNDLDERIELLNRAANLWIDRFNNFNRAVKPLEEILELDPTNAQAIDTLKGVYQKRRAWKPLLGLLEKEVAGLSGEEKLFRLIEMARLAAEKVSNHEHAADIWSQVLELDPENEEALQSLEKLRERIKDWKGLCGVLEKRVERTEDKEERIQLLTKMGTIAKERLKDADLAALAWKRLLDLQPGHAKSMRSLKEAYLQSKNWEALEELYSGIGDYEGLVEVLGIAADRADDLETRVKLSFRCAELYHDPINQPDRAIRHYERVLAVDEKNARAARELAPIYRRTEKWNRLLGVLEIALAHTEDTDERVLLMEDMREIAASRMNNRTLAYEWATRAFEELPTDAGVGETLLKSAEIADKYEEFVALLRKHIDKFSGNERLETLRTIAKLSLEKLGLVDDAVHFYNAVLEEAPRDRDAIDSLEEIYRSTARFQDLIGVFEKRIELAGSDEEKRELMFEVAKLLEDGMGESEKAAARYRQVLEIFPEDKEALMSLERIARLSEHWSELAEILHKRRNLPAVADEEWKAITAILAKLYDEQLGDASQSIATYEMVLNRFPGDEETMAAMEHFMRSEENREKVARLLEPHLLQAEQWKTLAWALTIVLENTAEPQERYALYMRLAEIYSERLGDERVTFKTLCAALREHPAKVELWERLERMAGQLDMLPELAERFEEAYRSERLGDEARLALAHRISHLLDTTLGQMAKAAPYYKTVFEADPNSAKAFEALEGYYTNEEKWEDLLRLYREAIDGGSTVYSLLDFQLKVCFILEEVKQDVNAAISAYRGVTELDPGNTQAVRALSLLYEEAGMWQELSDLLFDQLGRSEGEDARALRFRIGEIAERELHRREDALEQYELVLLEDPDNLRAQEALERLLEIPNLRMRVAKVLERTYEHQGAAEPLARVLVIELENEELDTPERVGILMRVADLRERRLSDPKGAFEVLCRALREDPAHADARINLARLADEEGFFEQYAALLDEVIPRVVEDVPLAAGLMTEVAQIYDEQLGELDKALEAYRRLLSLDPENAQTALVAVEALERILSGNEDWLGLLDVLRTKVRLLGDPVEEKSVLHRMAELEESVLERIPRAVGLFREILERDEMDLGAIYGLERLYERTEQWAELVGILRRRAHLENDPVVRKDLLLRVASLTRDRLREPDDAIAAFNAVLEQVGPDADALSALAELYVATNRWSNLLETYEAQEQNVETDHERVELFFKMGQLLRNKLSQPADAVVRLGEALALVPSHGPSREALEEMLEGPVRMDVIEILRPLYESEAEYEMLLKCSNIEAQEAEDPKERSRVLRKAAEIAEVGLEDKKKAFELLGKAFRDGSASPDLAKMIDDLERLAQNVDGFDVLVGLYRETGPDILDHDLQVRCSLRVAEIAHEIIEDIDLAREYYVRVLDIDGENSAAMDALEKIYESQEQFLELFEIYRRKVQLELDEERRCAILFKQARLCEERLSDVSGATTTYETILESEPESREAMDALERLYQRSERWADLMDLLEKRADIDEKGRVELLHRLGTLASQKLGDDERALDYFRRALEVEPGHAPTLASLEAAMEDEARRGRVAEMLEPVYKANGDWTKLIGALEGRLEYCDDPIERKEILREIGTLHEEQQGDLDSAFEAFARLFQEGIEDRSSWDTLGRLASVLEKWDRLAEVYAAALDGVVGDTPTSAELAFMLGEIYETRLSDCEKATEAYRRTLGFDPDDERAFSAVERMLLSTERWRDLLDLYREAADTAVDVGERKEFMFKIAKIHEEANKDLSAAIDTYRDVLDIDDRDAEAIKSIDRLFTEAGRYDDLAVHLRTQIDQVVDPHERNELRMRLGAIYESELRDVMSAVDVYEEALNEEGGDRSLPLSALERLILEENQRERIADILEPVYRETDEWKKLIVILRTQIEFIDLPAEKKERYTEVAELHEARGGNFILAFESLAEAFFAEPSDRQVLSELVRLAETIENWEELARVLSRVLNEIYDLDFKLEVLHLLGNTYDRKLDMPRKAIDAFKGALEINESDAESLEALEGLYNLIGDWEGLVGVLETKAAYAPTPEERAEVLRTKASIHEDLMSSVDDAVDSYRQALDADPSSELTMDALERLYEAKEEWNELIEIKRQRIDLSGESARVEVLRSIAKVFDEKLGEAFDAISAWRAVLELEPRDAEAIDALDRLFTAERMHAELLDNLQMQKQMANDQALWVDISQRIGELQEKELADLEGAIDSYSDVLGQQPTHAEAIAALERLAGDESVRARAIEVIEPLHRESARWDRLARILELKLEILDDPADRLKELVNLAELHENGRSDPAKAFEVYAKALAEAPGEEPVIESLERIAEAERLWDELDRVYAERADNVFEPDVETRLLMRLGRLRETHLSEPAKAIEAYRRALDSGSTEPELLNALDRLYSREQQWNELDEILDRKIELAATPDEISQCKIRQGRIRETEFDNIMGAVSAYRDVLETMPGNDEACAALEALLKRDDYVEEIVEVLTPVYQNRGESHKISDLFVHRLRVAEVDSERVQLYRDLAAHQEQSSDDLNAAFDAYAKAFAIDPTDFALLGELERLASELGAWTALVEKVEEVLGSESLDAMASVQLGLKVAKWAATNVGDPAKAEKLYRDVLEKEPEHAEALAELEELLRELGRYEDILPIMEKRAETIFDLDQKKQQFKKMAYVAQFELGDAEKAMQAFRGILDLDESDISALDALITLTEDTEDYSSLVELLETRAMHTTEISESNTFRHRAAALYVGPLENPDQALETYREVLQTNPMDKEASAQLGELLARMEKWEDLRDVLMDRLGVSQSDDLRIETLHRLAELTLSRLDEPEDAVGYLGDILAISPEDERASSQLETIYAKLEKWEELVELLEGRADRAREVHAAEEEMQLLVRIGKIWDEKLSDPDRATDIYERVLERDPEHTGALAALARLYESAGDWDRCSEVLQKAVAAGRGGPDEAEVHYRLARLNETQLGNPEAALEELVKAVSCYPGHAQANRALAEHFEKVGDTQGLLEALMREEAHLEDPEEKVAKLITIADLQKGPAKDPSGSVASLEKAKALSGENKDVLLRLSDAYIDDGRQDDAIPVIESLIDAETDGGKKRSKKAALYHQRLAKAYLARGESDKALENLENAYKLDITNVEVLVSLGKLYYEREDYDKAVKLFRALLLQKLEGDIGISKADVYWYVGDISLKQGDPRKAKGMFARGLDEDKDHERCKEGLAQVGN